MSLRARQRGLGTIGLIIYAVMAAAALAAIYGAYRFVVNIGVAEMRTKWAPLIEKCEAMHAKADFCRTDWDTAIAQRQQAMDANRQLAGDVTNLRTQADACSAATSEARTLADAAASERARAIATAKGVIDAFAADKRAALTRAGTPPSGTAAEQCTRIMLGLQDVAVREFRDRPPDGVKPGAQIAPGSTQPASGKGSVPDPRGPRLEVK